MQRWLSKLRSVVVSSSSSKTMSPLLPYSHRGIHSFRHSLSSGNSIFNSFSTTQLPYHHIGFQSPNPLSLFQLNQTRHYTKSKERRLKRLTPAVSKLKKYKIKPYSSFKSRFKTLKDGQIRRWHAGKRHNAHLKSKISKRRLRLPALVHPAYAKVMKKLNFYG